MNRVVFRNSRQLRLVGSFFPADSGSVVIMAHGFTSDRSSKGRFDRAAEALTRAGYGALMFDFSGCGESDDDTIALRKQVDDLRSAIMFAKSVGCRQFALWGHSLGSRICLQANPPEAKTMVLTGALTGPMHYRWEEYYSEPQLRAMKETGVLTERRESGERRRFEIEEQVLRDFAEFDQPAVLSAIRCPVLIVHGDADEEERQLLELSRRGLPYLPRESRLEVIPGADHSFLNHYDQVISLGVSWLSQFSPNE